MVKVIPRTTNGPRVRTVSSGAVAPATAAFDVIPIGLMNAGLRTVGGAGGVGAARRWRESERPGDTPVAAIRASGTALTKAGVERGRQEIRHNHLARATVLMTGQVATNALALVKSKRRSGGFPRKQRDLRGDRAFSLRRAFHFAMTRAAQRCDI